uniref:Ycf45 n=2 Tax=Grateloupia TaxID=31454 RepID=A0A6F8Z1J0_9FLOR|nr:Ycf45 [Grateloupia filicina]AWD77270.1 Ycf45 [Grateloupia filicina]BCB92364.1 Ycf45 [Grateloupia asiatica]
MLIADDLDKLLEILPDFICQPLAKHSSRKYLIEVVVDLGRRPEARFPNGPEYLSSRIISWQDLDYCIKRVGNFGVDNRSGIERTLHRISAIRNRKGNIIGLTCRVGRAIFGTISIIRDLLEKGQSLLFLGKPGVGKTTAIREVARVLADEMEKRVVIIDTSNEIAGDGDIPHPAIGRARRMQVARPELQHQVMIEAVENHMPEVIIIDEIGTELEALAARTIAERGVQLVGTAHGNYLESLIKNPTLSDLIGGIQYVTLSDEEAKRRGSQKSILERKAIPAFQVAIEIHERDNWIVHEKVDEAVDQILQGAILFIQRRKFSKDGSICIHYEQSLSTNFMANNSYNAKFKNARSLSDVKYQYKIPELSRPLEKKQSTSNILNTVSNKSISSDYKVILLYAYSINNQQIEATIHTLQLPIHITRNLAEAEVILALRSTIKQNTKLRQLAKSRQITIYTIHSSTIPNITRALKQMLHLSKMSSLSWRQLCNNKTRIEILALAEARLAVEKIVMTKKQSVQLLSRSANIRRLQHKLIQLYNLRSRSFGEEPYRSLRIYPD